MVRLTRIYTRTGDDGTTALGDGTRVPKTSPRIEAYGTVDELNSVLGLCLDLIRPGAEAGDLRARLLRLQQDLFDLGADLCVPLAPEAARVGKPASAAAAGAAPAVPGTSAAGEVATSPTSSASPAPRAALRIGPARVERLEHWIDAVNAGLRPLESFILPGGNPLAAQLHVARTVCRRAERCVQALAQAEPCNPQCTVFLNRLSDLLFVLARAAAGPDEILWMPTRDDTAGDGA